MGSWPPTKTYATHDNGSDRPFAPFIDGCYGCYSARHYLLYTRRWKAIGLNCSQWNELQGVMFGYNDIIFDKLLIYRKNTCRKGQLDVAKCVNKFFLVSGICSKHNFKDGTCSLGTARFEIHGNGKTKSNLTDAILIRESAISKELNRRVILLKIR